MMMLSGNCMQEVITNNMKTITLLYWLMGMLFILFMGNNGGNKA